MNDQLIFNGTHSQNAVPPDIPQILHQAVEAARLAPSGHNMQPWRFRLYNDHIDLFADRTRALPILDPDDHELILSCGVALFYLRLAIRQAGMGERVDVFPDASLPDLLARVWVTGPKNHNFESARLFANISERRTNRLSFYPRQLPEGLTEELSTVAQQEGAHLYVIPESVRPPLLDLVAEGAKELADSPDFRREVSIWLAERSDEFQSEVGIPNFPAEIERHLKYSGSLPSPLDAGNLLAGHETRLGTEAPLLAVLGTHEDGEVAWLAAGQALGHVLLHAAAVGVMAAFLDSPIQVPRLRPYVTHLLGEQMHPHLLLALGYAPYGRHTPRRPLEDLLLS
jgi:nitroreductase